MNFPSQDLSLKHISQSYQEVLQQYGEYVLDGLGNVVFRVGPNSGSIDLSNLLNSSTTASMAVSTASYAIYSATSLSASYSQFSEISNVAVTSYFSEASETASYAILAGVAYEALTASYSPNHLLRAGDTATGDIIGTDFVRTRSGTITRDGNGMVSQVSLTGGRTLIISRIDGYISSIFDGIRTWTYTRDGNNQITSWNVA